MADPFGIVGVLSTADVVFTRLFKYIKAVGKAEKEILDLAAEVKHLCWTLQSVKTAADDLKDLNGHAHLVDGKHISDCIATLDELREILSKYQAETGTDSATKAVRNRWKWPIQKSRVQDLKRKINDHNVAFATTLSANGMSMMLEMLGNTQSSTTTLEKVSKLLEASAQIELDKATQEILSTVGPVRPLEHQKTNAQLHHPGTGIWFLESDELKSWLTTQNSKLWVFGIPGAGKSILASAAIEKVLEAADPDNAVAYFYCDYKDSETQNPVNILGSLAEQVARQDARSFDKVKAFVYARTKNKDLHTFVTDDEELCKLIINMAENFESTTILVDGLDECEDVRHTTSCLVSLGKGSARIRTFLSSRRIPDVEDFMPDYDKISIAARSSDLRLYVASEIEKRMKPNNVRRLRIKDPQLKGEIMDRLINGAEGMFRWVSVQLDSFCEMPSDFDIREALQTLPQGLFPSYERVLNRISRKHPLTQRLVQCALKWITHHNMKVEALLVAVSIREDTHQLKTLRKCDVEDILLHCESFVRLSSDGQIIELAHFTVKEYLLSITSARPDLLCYKLDIEVDQQYLASTALTYLCCEDFKTICFSTEERNSRHKDLPFRQEAVLHWMHFARGCIESSSVQVPLMRLFNPEHSQCVDSWAQEYSLRKRTEWTWGSFGKALGQSAGFSIDWGSFTPLHWAAMLRLPGLCLRLGCIPGQPQSDSAFPTPLHMALIGERDIWEKWEQISAETLVAVLEEPDNSGVTQEDLLETIETLINAGADVNARWRLWGDNESMTPLAVAFYCTELKSFALLLGAGAQCELDMVEKFMRRLRKSTSQSSEFEDSVVVREFINCISEKRLAEGADEAFSSVVAKISTLLPEEKVSSRVVEVLAQAEGGLQQQVLLDSARYNHDRVMELLLRDPKIDCNFRNDDGDTALILAATHGRVHLLQMLLEHGAGLETADRKGRTALHRALEYGLPEVIDFLLEKGANPLITDYKGQNAWHFAARRKKINCEQIFKLLSGHGQVGADAVDEVGFTPWLLAVKNGNKEALSHLEALGANSRARDRSGCTAMHLAVRNSNIDVLRHLLELGLDPAIVNVDGHNALSYAAIRNRGRPNWSNFRLLLQHHPHLLLSGIREGMSALDQLLKEEFWGYTMNIGRPDAEALAVDIVAATNISDVLFGIFMHITGQKFAISDGTHEMLKHTLDRDPLFWPSIAENEPSLAKVADFLSNCLRTILGLPRNAPQSHKLEDISILLIDRLPETCLRGLRVNGQQILTIGLRRSDSIAAASLRRFVDLETRDLEAGQNTTRYNALECAFASPCDDAVFETILEAAEDFNSRTPLGMTLLHVAAQTTYENRVRLLLSKGLDPNETDRRGNNALHFACCLGRSNGIPKILLEAGADPWLTNSHGISPVHLAIANGGLEFLQLVPVESDRWRDVYPNKDANRTGPLKLHHFAVFHGQLKCLKYLLSLPQYFRVEDITTHGRTILSIAVRCRQYHIVAFLLENGAKIQCDQNGNTVLHNAAELGDLKIVEALLKHGFDPLQPGSYGRTPLSIARARNSVEILAALEAFIADQTSKIPSIPTAMQESSNAASVSESRRRELQYAIDSNDLLLCQRLVSGKHVEVVRCSCCGVANALLYSLSQSKEVIALWLMENGLDLDELAHRTWSALHFCASNNFRRALDRLLDKCPMLLFLRTDVHPLHLAVLHQSNECLRVMLERSASCWENLNSSICLSLSRANDSALAKLPLRQRLHHQLIRLEDITATEISPTLANAVSASDLLCAGVSTPLHCAAYVANVEATLMLLKQGADVDQASPETLDTALSIAAKRRASAVVSILLDHGASANHFTIFGDPCGKLIRYFLPAEAYTNYLADVGSFQQLGRLENREFISGLAATSRVLELAEALSHPREITAPDASGISALHRCWNDGPAVMQTYLLNSGFDLSGSTKYFGGALNYRWLDRRLGLLKRVLRRLGQDQSLTLMNLKPEGRSTPLYAAAAMGQLKVLQLLLSFGADMNLVGGELGTPLIAAASYGRLSIVKELINAGAAFSCFCPALEETANVFDQAQDFPAIQRWLLVGRWMERKRIGWVEEAAGCVDGCGGSRSSAHAEVEDAAGNFQLAPAYRSEHTIVSGTRGVG